MISYVTALLCLAVPATASALCFTKAEMRAVAAVVATPLIDGAATQCAKFPGAAPTLTAARPGLPARFRTEAAAAVPVLGPKVAQIMNQPAADPVKAVAAIAPIIDLMLSNEVAKLDAKACGVIDEAAGALLPLGDAQVVSLLGAVLVIVARSRPTRDFSICESPAG